jgi:nucleotide-binding universal stress UspA family protein
MFKTICVGFDGSEPSENALRTACLLGREEGATVHVIHAPLPETVAFALGAAAGYPAVTAVPTDADTQKATEELLDRARKIAAEVGISDITTHIGEGNPAKAVTDCAKSVQADLIVSGRRGLGNFSALLLGSTSLDIAREAPCAHLTVK